MEIEKGKKGWLRNELKKLLLNNKVDCQNLKPGDHIFAHHGVSLNSHHGIYVNGEQVIHFTSPESKPRKGKPCQKCGYHENVHRGVVQTCLGCFLSKGSHFVNHSLRLYQYNVPTSCYTSKNAGSSSTSAPKPIDEVIYTATGFLNEMDFSLFGNDNESFAIYCKTGTPKSEGDDHSKTSKKKTSKITTHKKNTGKNKTRQRQNQEEKEEKEEKEEGEEEEEEEEEGEEEEEEEEEEDLIDIEGLVQIGEEHLIDIEGLLQIGEQMVQTVFSGVLEVLNLIGE